MTDVPPPESPEELAAVLGLVVAGYVKRHGNTPRTRIEALGALEDARAELYNNPKRFGATN